MSTPLRSHPIPSLPRFFFESFTKSNKIPRVTDVNVPCLFTVCHSPASSSCSRRCSTPLAAERAIGSWVSDRKKICVRYLRGFFVIDILSIIPFHEVQTGGELKALKLLRLLRLFKLLRILRSGRILKRFEDSVNIDYNVITLCKFVVGTLMIAHWLACMFQLLARVVGQKDDWVVRYFSNFIDGDLFASCHAATDFNNELRACLNISPWATYIASIYWALVTMSTIGYGDVVPTSTAERFFIIFAMLLGTSVFAYVVGSVCTIVASMDKKQSEHHELMDTLNAMTRELGLSAELQLRLRDYFRYCHLGTNMDDWQSMLELMSPKLRGEVAMKQCGMWINNVPFFRGAPERFIVDLALKLKSETYPQTEEIVLAGEISTKMYIVEKGVVGGKGRVFTSGKVFGEEVLGGGSQTTFTARAMTYCVVFALLGLDLDVIAAAFPVMQRRLRVAGCHGMVRDSLMAFTKTWGQISAGAKSSPDVPEELDQDASVADVAIKRRVDHIFSFCLSLSKQGTNKPSIPADAEAAFHRVAGRAVTPPVRVSGGGVLDGGLGDGGVGQVLAAMAGMKSSLEGKIASLEAQMVAIKSA